MTELPMTLANFMDVVLLVAPHPVCTFQIEASHNTRQCGITLAAGQLACGLHAIDDRAYEKKVAKVRDDKLAATRAEFIAKFTPTEQAALLYFFQQVRKPKPRGLAWSLFFGMYDL